MSTKVNHAHFPRFTKSYLEALDCSTCRHLVAVEDLVGDTHFRIHIEVGPDGHKMFVAVVSWRLLTETRSLSWL